MSIKFALCTLAVLALAGVAPRTVGANSLIEDYASKFVDARKALDQDTLKVAEGFAIKVGDQHFYRYKMNTLMMSSSSFDSVNFGGFLEFRNSLNELRLPRDADAALDFLTTTSGRRLEDLSDKTEAAKGVEETILPACQKYVESLKSVFEADELLAAERDGKLSTECKAVGGSQEVKEFVVGWAHYHVCKVLAQGDRTTLIDRVAKRAQDKQRISRRTSEILKQRKGGQ